MAERFVRIGSMEDIHVYDDADHATAMDTDDRPIEIGAAAAATHALRQDQVPTLTTIVSAAAVIPDHSIVRGDGGARGIQGSGLTLDDSDNLSKSDDLEIDCSANKTVVLVRSVYDDLRFPVGSVKGAGAFPPTDTAYRGGIVLEFDTGPNSESIQFVAQLPHTYKEGTDLEFHIHWTIATDGAGLGAENVKWDFTYSWANIGSDFPAEDTQSLTVDVQARVADRHYMDSIYTINGAGKTISSVLICSLTRDISVANDYTDSAYFLEADFHYEIDTQGSRQQTAK